MSTENKINTTPGVQQRRVISCCGVTYEKTLTGDTADNSLQHSLTGKWQDCSNQELKQDELYLHPEITNSLCILLSLLPSLQIVRPARVAQCQGKKIPAGMQLLWYVYRNNWHDSSFQFNLWLSFPRIFYFAYARIWSYLWLTNISLVKTPDFKHCQIEFLTILHCENELNDLIKII